MAEDKSEFDYAVDFLIDRNKSTIEEIRGRFKNTRPFRKEPIPQREIRELYNSLSPENMDELIAKYGAPTVNEFIRRMETGGR